MLDLGAHLRLSIFDLALHLANDTFLAVFLVAAGTRRNRPNYLAAPVLRPFLNAGVTGIAAHVALLAVQQLIGLPDVRNIGGGADNTVYQSRIGIDANVRFHAEIVLIALLGRMHFRVALALFIFRRARRMNDRGVDDSAVTQQQATVTQIAIDDIQNSGG
jgi:hypothetical protein